MAQQFVKKETEKLLDRLSLEEGISKSEIIHRAVMDYCQEPEVPGEPFNPSDIAGLAQTIRGKPTQRKLTAIRRTDNEIKAAVARLRAMGYSEADIAAREAYWRGQ